MNHNYCVIKNCYREPKDDYNCYKTAQEARKALATLLSDYVEDNEPPLNFPDYFSIEDWTVIERQLSMATNAIVG